MELNPNEEKIYRNPLVTSKLRNKLCICGSGKKTKKCHGMSNAISRIELDQIKTWHNIKMQEVMKDLEGIKSIVK